MLATKVFFKMHDGPGGSGLSRKAIMEQIDASLSRLGTDYVDLYQIHRFDPETPVEETMEALHDVVKAGKARYIGASSMWAWQFAKLQHAADLDGWTRFVSMQNQYSLLQREEEREMFGLLADQGVGSIPWSPLAKGRLARPWSENTTRRAGTDPLQARYVGEENEPIVAAVQQVAEARGVPMAQVALAWVLHNPVVAAPIVGPTKPHHLADAVAALDLELTDDEVGAGGPLHAATAVRLRVSRPRVGQWIYFGSRRRRPGTRCRRWLLRLRQAGGRLLLGAAQSQQLMPERGVDESAVVRVGGARVGVPVEETAGEAHLDDRNLPLPLQPADMVGHHVQQLALADLVQVPQLGQQVRSPVQQLRRLRPAPVGERHAHIPRGCRRRPHDDQALRAPGYRSRIRSRVRSCRHPPPGRRACTPPDAG